MLYISVDGQVIEERNQSRSPYLESYWTDGKRVDRQNDFYHYLAELDGIVFIDGARPHNEVLSDCSSYLVDGVAKMTYELVVCVICLK